MAPASPVLAKRRAPWPYALLAVLLGGALWLLDTHQPSSWPDAATPWFAHVRALSPATWVVDQLNARVPLASDVPFGSAVILLITALCTLATLLAVDVPPVLGIAVATGVAATRSLWSTASPGYDALPIAAVAGVVAAVARRIDVASGTLPVLATFVVSPPATWMVVPASLASPTSRRWRVGLAVGAIGAAIAVQSYLLRRLWGQTPCLASGPWTSALAEALRPGLSADASPFLALRQTAGVFAGDVHLFGVATAAFGLTYQLPRAPHLRKATIAALAGAVVVVAAGLLPPAFAAALLLPWWAPWFGVGLTELVRLTGRRHAGLALGAAVAFALLLPPLRHAVVVAGPWRAGMPAMTRAVSATFQGGVVATDDAALTRRLRMAGTATVPADPQTLATCVTSGHDVHAVGPMAARAQQQGHRVVERPVRAPLSALLQDVRHDQLIALAMAPGAISWAGPAGFTALSRLGVARETPATAAIGIVARTDRGGAVRTGRLGIDISVHEGDEIGGRRLVNPLSVGAHDDDTSVAMPPARLAAGRQASLAIFDRGGEPVLRGVGTAAAGLPIALGGHPDWRHVLVRDQPACVTAGATWTPLPASMARLSVPLVGVTPANPAIVLIASDAPPQITIDGVAAEAPGESSRVTLFDRDLPGDQSRISALWQKDRLTDSKPLPGRWLARVELRAGGTSYGGRASVTPGVPPTGWLVRLASAGLRHANLAVCGMVGGERMLLGQSGPVDDETADEIGVTAGYGWHTPERLHGSVFQWSAAATATATFTLERPEPVVLALDASGASTPAGRQPLSVRVNDHVVNTDWPGAGRATIPEEATRGGVNTITVSVPQVVQPGGDVRALGVQVRQLRVIRWQAR